MIEMVQYDYIRFLYYNQNKSKRAIAREVGVHRNTVTKAITMNIYCHSPAREGISVRHAIRNE
ncbi:MAG: hypothetical protein ACOX25_09060 [Caldicoprobacterales bacterium]